MSDEELELIEKETGVSREEIVAVYTNKEKGERMVFVRSVLINQLQRIVPQINESFDGVYAEEFKKISSDLSEVMPILFEGGKKAFLDKNELIITYDNLLRNAVNTIMGSVHVLRGGFRFQSGMLLRGVIETCATVTHLILEPNLLEDFKNDKLKSTRSISVASKQIPLLGQAWGLLSKRHVHINSLHADRYPLMQYVDKQEIPVNVTIGIIGMTIMILRITAELAFFRYVGEHNYWKLEANKVVFIPPNKEKLSWIGKQLTVE